MITHLDHVVLAVRDFEAAVEGYEVMLGRRARRTAAAGGAARAWFRLANVALEIIAPAGEGVAGERVRARLDAFGEGPALLAFAVEDLDAAQARLTRRGVMVRPVVGSDVQALAAAPESTGGAPMVFAQFASFAPAEPLAAAGSVVDALDHVVLLTSNPERAAALYGARLGLDLRLDRTQPWGARQLFFRCGDGLVEVVHDLKAGVCDEPDRFGGYAWRVADAAAAHARLAAAGLAVSELRAGRKPGTRVFTVKDRTFGAATIVMDAAPAPG
jgi:catechol 2,3-dioxygenase-like lactoylglutathione lyase family enzyme